MSTRAFGTLLLASLALASCRAETPTDAPRFPDARRDVAPIVSDSFSTEDARDRLGEAELVMELAGVAPGMVVADIGAGEGYYTVRLARAVGEEGRVLAQDIQRDVRDQLARRVQREDLENVAVRLGAANDPRLPARSFDRIFLVHMYHEVAEPYEFLWHLRAGLKPGGQVIVVDADRPIKRHGMPPELLDCEFAALGLRRVSTAEINGTQAYFAAFEIGGPRPAPEDIEPCS
ncbi:class I SAM-dependent methyltransferase [Sphingomicrobium lutaoense]|uniref:Ubiquinone/menaquinone biosynthesis C-methylase UbiE n=1 Tax=Sphingomicrobium lutaoense TaxID=515949 RepID=A0A839Z695_9SPHN|nr:methyltransferase domain-containing protein [Sphingomicrobium lutaoense]MBB3764234.1 ubiquinone/menaquinone biosynthesis C-methylase UbiE [Sphingomicrobium lutaoense]